MESNGHLDIHTAPELWRSNQSKYFFYIHIFCFLRFPFNHPGCSITVAALVWLMLIPEEYPFMSVRSTTDFRRIPFQTCRAAPLIVSSSLQCPTLAETETLKRRLLRRLQSPRIVLIMIWTLCVQNLNFNQVIHMFTQSYQWHLILFCLPRTQSHRTRRNPDRVIKPPRLPKDHQQSGQRAQRA